MKVMMSHTAQSDENQWAVIYNYEKLNVSLLKFSYMYNFLHTNNIKINNDKTFFRILYM